MDEQETSRAFVRVGTKRSDTRREYFGHAWHPARPRGWKKYEGD